MSNSSMVSSPGWCLRFLSGAVRGRSIPLPRGSSLLGSGADCQVLLPASDAQAHHLELTVGELALSVRRVGDAAARINGEAMATTRRSVIVGDVISLGSIDFQIERSYPAGAAAAAPREPEHADSMFLDGTAAAVAEAAPPPARHRRAWAVGLCVWALVMTAAWWGLAGNAAPGRPTDQVDLGRLEAALKDFPEAEVLAGPSGRISVQGFVESQARRQALQRAVQPFGERVAVHVHAVDELIGQARGFVADPGLAVTYAGRGRLVVSGRTEGSEAQARIQRLAADLHPAVLVSDHVQYRPKAAETPAETKDQWAAWQRALPSRMVSITEDAGGMRYIQLANGNVYFEGSVLKSGAELNGLRAEAPAPEASAPAASTPAGGRP